MNITMLYATQTGTTTYVVESVAGALRAQGHTVTEHNIEVSKQPDLTQAQLLVLVAPTYDDGKLYAPMEAFLQTPPMQQNLAHLKVAVIGLGSRDYPKFCTAADILESWATQKQLQLAAPTLRIDGFPADPQPLTTWAAQLK